MLLVWNGVQVLGAQMQIRLSKIPEFMFWSTAWAVSELAEYVCYETGMEHEDSVLWDQARVSAGRAARRSFENLTEEKEKTE